MIRVGEQAWIAVTDHPDNPHALYEGATAYYWSTREEAQAICDARNKAGGEWTFYPELVTARPRRRGVAKGRPPGQMGLWDE